MEQFFAKPTPERIATHIYHEIIARHECGGREYRYKVPQGLSISFVNDVIDRLAEYLLDADVIEFKNGVIVVDWS